MNLKQNILGKVKSVLIFHYFVLQQEKSFKDEKLIQGYLAHELDNWSMNESNCLHNKNMLVWWLILIIIWILIINIIKRNFIYNSYGILFDGFGLSIFGYRFTLNFMISNVDNNLSKNLEILIS